MRHRRSTALCVCWRYAPLFVAWTTLLIASAGLAAPTQRLNVLFIASDDMNVALGCYGDREVNTPALDRLTSKGMRFDAAFCQAPLCNPSRVSLLSGLRPDRTGVYTLFTPTREQLGDAVMLPECFRQNGYWTVQVGKIFHTGPGFEDPQSWDVSHYEEGKQPPPDQVLAIGDPPGPVKHTIDWAVLKTPDEKTPDGIVARRAAGYMKQAVGDGKPFFIAAGFRRPHAPFAVPKKYFDMYPPEAASLPPAAPRGYADTMLPAALNHAWGPRPLTPQEQRELRAAYFASNTFVDAQVNVLLQTIDELDLWKNTVIVFFGDHGYHLGDHGGLWHKNSLFEEACRVPLIVYAPGMKAAGKPCPRLVELVDLYPTLIELCGLTPPRDLDGKSLAPLLDSPSLPWKDAVYSVVARAEDRTKNVEHTEFLGRAVRTERWRYVEWDDGKRGIELYDRQSDPQEFNNVAQDPAHANAVRELHDLLVANRSSPAE
jgi:uncharacterized sulfatase